jgi:hypothetical protein
VTFLSRKSLRNECLKNRIYFTDDNRVNYDGDFGSNRPSCYDKLRRNDDGAFDWDRGIYTLRRDGRIISFTILYARFACALVYTDSMIRRLNLVVDKDF